MLPRKKAQSSMEAAILISFMVLSMIILLKVASEKIIETQEMKDRQVVEDLVSVIETEIKLAASAEDGYTRVFDLPKTLDGKEYVAELYGPERLKTKYSDPNADHSEIVIKYANELPGYERVIALPKTVNGSFCEAMNVISKKNGAVNMTCNCPIGYKDIDGDFKTINRTIFCGEALGPDYVSYHSSLPDCNDDDSGKWQMIDCYIDNDNDEHGQLGTFGTYCGGVDCQSTDGLSATYDDCDDTRAGIWQGVTGYRDHDGDDYTVGEQVSLCDVGLPASEFKESPSTIIDCNDDPDNGGSSVWQLLSCYPDNDGDRYGAGTLATYCAGNTCEAPAATPEPPTYLSSVNTDCNDNDGTVYQILQCFTDADGDGWGTGTATTSCRGSSCPAGYANRGGDCDDNLLTGTAKQVYKYQDNDGDGYGTNTYTCTGVNDANYVSNDNDCNDALNTGDKGECKRVFVTSGAYNGNLGGLAGADTICQQLATNAHRSGTWKAWLSDDTYAAKDRLTQSILPYAKFNNEIIANNWNDLVDGMGLSSAIDKTETGNSAGGTYGVWTGTNWDGGSLSPNCLAWTSNYFRGNWDYVAGWMGSYDYYTFRAWTVSSGEAACSSGFHLYCFEQ